MKQFLPRICFVYVDAAKHSGQRRATELIISCLKDRGYDLARLGTPALDRESGRLTGLIKVAWNLARIWCRGFLILRQQPGVLHINLGQSAAALLREGAFMWLRGFTPGCWPVIISLHGSWFMTWPRSSLKARWLGCLARRAWRITVLGPDQRDKLVELGVRRRAIEVIDNTCELRPATGQEMEVKQAGQPVRVLFLGLLADTKGYPEFLEGLMIYSDHRHGPRLSVTFCGDIALASHSARFVSIADATKFIEQKLDDLRARGWIDIRWIKGAEGEAKADMFRTAAIFVLPTKLDAQPIVLLEAMASGCAILTTNVGQIAQSVGPEAAVILDEVSPQAIANGLAGLALSPERRLQMVLAGRQQFISRFTREIHDAKWRELVDQAGKLNPDG